MTHVLMVVDVQQNMFAGPWCVPNAGSLLAKISDRIDQARSEQIPVIFVQNDGPEGEVDEPFSEGWELAIAPATAERVVRKTTQNVFESNPELARELRAQGVTELEFCGVQSELCLQASALGALQHGFAIGANRDLHGTFDGGWPGATEGPSAKELSDSVQARLESEAGDRWWL